MKKMKKNEVKLFELKLIANPRGMEAQRDFDDYFFDNMTKPEMKELSKRLKHLEEYIVELLENQCDRL